MPIFVRFGFSEKATKFEKIFVILLARASCSVQQRTCQKVDEDFSKQIWPNCIIQTLIEIDNTRTSSETKANHIF